MTDKVSAHSLTLIDADPAPHIKSTETEPALPPRKRQHLPSRDGYCHDCRCSNSSIWRSGPSGAKTLCDVCWKKHSKLEHQQRDATIASFGSRPEAPTMSAVRESSNSSSSTFCTNEQKEARLRAIRDRALKRKAAVSPLRDRCEDSLDRSTVSDELQLGNKIAAVKPVAAVSDLSVMSDDAADEVPTDAIVIEPENGRDSPSSAASTGSLTKRRRTNAHQKAKLIADELLGEGGKEDGRKQRCTAAKKNVRFQVPEGVEGMNVDAEGKRSSGDADLTDKDISSNAAGGQRNGSVVGFTPEIVSVAQETTRTMKDRPNAPKQGRPRGRPRKAEIESG